MARRGWVFVLALALALLPALASGQTTATLSGVVQDKDGRVPGATVVLKNVKTGETLPSQVTNETGAYSFPGLVAGTYSVTVTMQGFKTVSVETRVAAGTTNTLAPV